jgi:hypothetical protein
MICVTNLVLWKWYWHTCSSSSVIHRYVVTWDFSKVCTFKHRTGCWDWVSTSLTIRHTIHHDSPYDHHVVFTRITSVCWSGWVHDSMWITQNSQIRKEHMDFCVFSSLRWLACNYNRNVCISLLFMGAYRHVCYRSYICIFLPLLFCCCTSMLTGICKFTPFHQTYSLSQTCAVHLQ